MIIFYLSHLLNHHNTLSHDSFYQTCLFLNEFTLWSYVAASTKLRIGDVISQFLFRYDNFLFESFVESSQDICQLIKSKFLPLNSCIHILIIFCISNLSIFMINGNVINHWERVSWIIRRTETFLGIATMSWHDPKNKSFLGVLDNVPGRSHS